MCGIVGCAGTLGIKHERVFSELLIMNQLRGFDSVGLAKVGYSRLPEVAKSVENPIDFITSAPYVKALKGMNRVLLGHNRAATIGKVVVENAHPFTHDHITGVHNGTLTYRRDLEDHANFAVDSDNLFYHLAKKGVRDLWVKLWGAAAIVWWDAKDESINFLRNKDRPLFLAYDKEHKVVMWASEFYMLQAVCFRNGIAVDKAPFPIEVDTLYSFSFGDKFFANKVLEPVTMKIAAYEVKPYKQLATGWEWMDSDSDLPSKNERPEWLAHGKVIDCMFEDTFTINNVTRFEGFSPLDDRVNVFVRYANGGVNAAIDLRNKASLYRGTVDLIAPIYRKGNLEWDVTVRNVAPAVNADGSEKTIEDLEDEYTVPFEEADIDCKTLCTFKSEKNCNRCQLSFGKNQGSWTTKRGEVKHCCWCGVEMGDSEIAYLTKDKEDLYCVDCFENVLKWLANRKMKGYN
jgi:hypothetical protein